MEKEIKSVVKETYISPDIEVVNIESEQNILQAASGNFQNNDMEGEDW